MKGYAAIIAALCAVVVSLAGLSIYYQRTLQMETAEQFNRQQLLLAGSTASLLKHYLDSVSDGAVSIARSVAEFGVRREDDLVLLTNGVYMDMEQIRKRIELRDRSGRLLFSRGDVGSGPVDGETAGGRGEVSCAGGPKIEQYAGLYTVAAPVCRSDVMSGTVTVSMGIQDVAAAFLGPITSGSRGYAWMMDEKGNLLYHPSQPEMVGRNLYRADDSCFRCHKTFDLEKKIIEGRGDFYGRYVAPTGEDKILAFSTAPAGDSRWIVAVTAPYSEVTMAIKRSMRVYTWIIIVIFLSASCVAAVLIVLNRKRQQAEEQARREREIEMMHSERLAFLQRLTSDMASEIGNPLSSVFSFLDVLMNMEDDELKRETLETMHFHVSRISDILEQLSVFSKMSPVTLGPCRVNSLIEGSLALIQYDRKVRGITIVRDLSPDLPEIITDGGQLSHVIVNLVLNAADAMAGGGTLTIRSRLEEGRISLAFEDTGVGISRENLDRIFDPFYSTKEKGTGLGLAVSSGIVRKLRGTLTVRSEEGKGSTFLIVLPVNGAA